MLLKDTTKLLLKLRTLMKDKSVLDGKCLQAYVIPSSDAHGNGYLCQKDKRRQFITGFSGSSGTAVVTETNALLWTDGRYFLQATQELDSNWQLMKDGLAETPSIGDWLTKNLPSSSIVGIDATLYEEDFFVALSDKLKINKCELYHVNVNLIDLIKQSDDEKTFLNFEPLVKLDEKFAGKSTREKLGHVRAYMETYNLNAFVVTSLDEIAWLLNLRGRDIPYCAVFFAYCIITKAGCKLFTNLERLCKNVSLNDESFKTYLLGEDSFEFYEYEEFFNYFKNFIQNEFVENYKNEAKKPKVFISSASSHAIHAIVPIDFVHKDLSFVTKLKVIKNPSEIDAAKKIHARDSAVLVEFFYLLNKKLMSSTPDDLFNFKLNEYNLAKFLDGMRMKAENAFSPSFETICSIGSNSAIIHYKPEKDNCKTIESENILLLDSGGHYLDLGTTDVTRTIYYGECENITAYQKECFTRVLKGHIQLALKIFPSGTKSEFLDSFARQSLWQVGLDYRHGTGHGVGALLNVHELPIMGVGRKPSEIGIQENMIVTIEPGYYEDDKFGIRIENCVLTVKAETPYKYSDTVQFIRFEPLTYVPIQRDFIEKKILTHEEINWINDYHAKCLTVTGNELIRAGKKDVYDWLSEQTKPI